MLLMNANRFVSADRLATALWNDAPPQSHVSNLHTYLSRLRQALHGIQLETAAGGYRVTAAEPDLDLLLFRSLVGTARRQAELGNQAEAATGYRTALDLWRGRPVEDLTIPVLLPQITGLEQEQLAVTEEWLDAELAAGRAAEMVSELTTLTGLHPLRERLRGQLMLALAQVGRRADALEAYTTFRSALVEELGVEPGLELQRTHGEILRGEVTPAVSNRPSAFPICQLPADIPAFTGRTAVLERLEQALTGAHSATPVVVVSGPPGVGKTALAVHLAHGLRDRFPDGQVFVPMAGASTTPRDQRDVLAELLHNLGVAGSAVPDSIEARAAAYRAQLADRRVLVLLDDARDPAQIRQLIPGTPGCAVVVTGRNRLSCLDTAGSTVLEPLSDNEARVMLSAAVGAARITAETHAADRIVAACGGLPLALRIASARLVGRPDWTLRSFAERIRDEGRRLDELSVSDLHVRASLALSFEGLTEPDRRAFQLLSALGLIDFACWAAAAVLGQPESQVDAVIDRLVNANLLEPRGVDVAGQPRYRLHDLLRIVAHERAVAEGGQSELEAAFHRLIGTATALTTIADSSVARNSVSPWHTSEVGSEARAALAVRVPHDGVTWLAAEHGTILAIALRACDLGLHTAAARLSAHLTNYLYSGAWIAHLNRLHSGVRQAALDAGDERLALPAAYMLASVHALRGDRAAALQGLTECAADADRLGELRVLGCSLIGRAFWMSVTGGGSEEAVRLSERSAGLFCQLGDPVGEVSARRAMGLALTELGRVDEAAEVLERACATARELSEPFLVGLILNTYAPVLLNQGEYLKAKEAAEEGVTVLSRVGNRVGVETMRSILGLAEVAVGNRDRALSIFRQVRGYFDQIGDELMVILMTRNLAAAMVGEGQARGALPIMRDCLAVLRRIGSPRRIHEMQVLLAVALERAGHLDEAELARAEAGDPGLGATYDRRIQIVLTLTEPVALRASA